MADKYVVPLAPSFHFLERRDGMTRPFRQADKLYEFSEKRQSDIKWSLRILPRIIALKFGESLRSGLHKRNII